MVLSREKGSQQGWENIGDLGGPSEAGETRREQLEDRLPCRRWPTPCEFTGGINNPDSARSQPPVPAGPSAKPNRLPKQRRLVFLSGAQSGWQRWRLGLEGIKTNAICITPAPGTGLDAPVKPDFGDYTPSPPFVKEEVSGVALFGGAPATRLSWSLGPWQVAVGFWLLIFPFCRTWG